MLTKACAPQVGLAEKSVLLAYHPDAEDWINVNNDLEKLLLELRDPSKRFARQVIPAAVWSLPLVSPCAPALLLLLLRPLVCV